MDKSEVIEELVGECEDRLLLRDKFLYIKYHVHFLANYITQNPQRDHLYRLSQFGKTFARGESQAVDNLIYFNEVF